MSETASTLLSVTHKYPLNITKSISAPGLPYGDDLSRVNKQSLPRGTCLSHIYFVTARGRVTNTMTLQQGFGP